MTDPRDILDPADDAALDGAIDAALRRRLPVPDDTRLQAIVQATAASRPEGDARDARGGALRFPPLRRLAIAAIVALAAVAGVWLIVQSMGGGAPDGGPFDPAWRTMAQVYDMKVRDGYEPDVVCRDQDEFEAWFTSNLGHGLRLHDLPRDTRALGLAYCNVISPRTIAVMFDVDGAEVMVFVDATEHRATDGDPFEGLPERGLYVHRRAAGDLVLYEVTPRETPATLDLLYSTTPEANDVRGG